MSNCTRVPHFVGHRGTEVGTKRIGFAGKVLIVPDLPATLAYVWAGDKDDTVAGAFDPELELEVDLAAGGPLIPTPI